MNKPELKAFEIIVPKIGPQLIYMDISMYPVNKPG